MRKIIKGSFKFIVLGTLLMYSCKSDFLNEKIDNRTLIETLDEMEALLVALNPTAGYLFTDFMTDDYEYLFQLSGIDRDKFYGTFRIYDFTVTKKSFLISEYPPDNFNPNAAWLACYNRILNASMVIKKAKEYKVKSDKEEKRKNCIIGRALAIRAYSNFLLINLFAKHYAKETASDDVGIPYLYKYEGKAIVKYKRETVGKVYDNIEADLLEAVKLIDDKYIENLKYSFSSLSTYALLSRFYLYKKEWDKSIKYANMVLQYRNKILDIKKLAIEEEYSPHSYAFKYFLANNVLLRSAPTNTFLGSSMYGYYTHPLKNFLKKINANVDFHLVSTNNVYPYLIVAKKNYDVFSSQVSLFTVEELYYNKAEASIGKADLKTAKELLVLLIESDIYTQKGLKRMKEKIKKATTKNDVLELLLIAKRVRFFAEGMRWFDIKRHQIPVKHKTRTGISEIKGGNPEEYVIQPPLEEFDFGGI